MNSDKTMMLRALELAKKGRGRVNPNPMVGAVIVKEGRIIGEGYHTQFGNLHAEREAIKNMAERGENGEGATLYVTLEPCCHYGKTPPCTEAIIESKISRVVVAQRDPNPLVSGKGIEILSGAGIDISVGLCESEATALNRYFNHWVSAKRPYVVMKAGMTLDGKLSAADGTSQWITSEEARSHQHELRYEVMAIMVGSKTALNDNPMLTCRKEGADNKKLYRVVIDRQLQLPEDLNIFKVTPYSPTLVFCENGEPQKINKLENLGVEVCVIEHPFSMNAVMAHLGKIGIDSVLLEGGATLNAVMLGEKLINAVHLYMAPKLSGSGRALGLFGCAQEFKIEELPKLENMVLDHIGEELLVKGDVRYE